MSGEERWERNPDALVTTDGDAQYVTDVERGDVYELNAPAALVLAAANDGMTLAGVVDALRERYPEVPREELLRDAREVLAEFVRLGILKGR